MNARLPEVSPVPARLALLRDAMAREDLAAYLVPSADPHLSEYLPERWQARRWLSGFTGSVGTLVVTAEFAGLWVDSRYWVQADAELAGTGVQLMKMTGGQQSAPHVDWLAQNVAAGATVGVDGAVLGVAAARGLTAALSARGIALRTDLDLLDAIWPERPGLPGDAVFEHVAPQADTTRASKLADVRRAMHAQGAQWHFVSTLDDLAWLFNLRGADVNFNPVFVAHAMIGADRATLFVADGKVPPALAASLAQDGVDVRAYDAARASLAALPDGATLLIDPRRVTFGTLEAVPAGVKLVEAVNPSTFAKSRKTSAEIEHVRVTMEHDGAALAEFFTWFEQAVNRETITELTIEEKLTAARARRPGYVSASFATIAGFNANGAMPHYHATRESHATIAGDGLLLIDSGGQYMTGTTDITRVVPVGTVSDLQRRDFTIVLKSMMALSRALPARHPLADARRDRARADVGGRARLWARHRAWRRLLPERARRPAGHLALRAGRAVHGDGRGHDHVDRAGRVPPGQVGHPDREPGREPRGREDGIRRFPRVRDADAVSDRHALRADRDAARRRARVAEHVSRDGARARRPTPERRCEGVAGRAHAADLTQHAITAGPRPNDKTEGSQWRTPQ